MISKYMNYKLYIFDFDNTLISCDCTHQGYYTIEGFHNLSKLSDIEFMDTFFPNRDLIFNLFNYIIKNDSSLAIASFGHKMVIFYILNRYWEIMSHNNILTLIDNNIILGIEDVEIIKPDIRKNEMLEKLMKHYNIIDKSLVLFIDDNINNINIANSNHYKSYWINNSIRYVNGINNQDLINNDIMI